MGVQATQVGKALQQLMDFNISEEKGTACLCRGHYKFVVALRRQKRKQIENIRVKQQHVLNRVMFLNIQACKGAYNTDGSFRNGDLDVKCPCFQL